MCFENGVHIFDKAEYLAWVSEIGVRLIAVIVIGNTCAASDQKAMYPRSYPVLRPTFSLIKLFKASGGLDRYIAFYWFLIKFKSSHSVTAAAAQNSSATTQLFCISLHQFAQCFSRSVFRVARKTKGVARTLEKYDLCHLL